MNNIVFGWFWPSPLLDFRSGRCMRRMGPSGWQLYASAELRLPLSPLKRWRLPPCGALAPRFGEPA